MSQHYGAPLSVTVKNGRLSIVIGVEVLAHATSYADWANPWNDAAQNNVRTFAITDPVELAADVKRAMLDEREDGSSLLSDFLDKATEAALNDGSTACEYDHHILHGQFSPLERWATSEEPK